MYFHRCTVMACVMVLLCLILRRHVVITACPQVYMATCLESKQTRWFGRFLLLVSAVIVFADWIDVMHARACIRVCMYMCMACACECSPNQGHIGHARSTHHTRALVFIPRSREPRFHMDSAASANLSQHGIIDNKLWRQVRRRWRGRLRARLVGARSD